MQHDNIDSHNNYEKTYNNSNDTKTCQKDVQKENKVAQNYHKEM